MNPKLNINTHEALCYPFINLLNIKFYQSAYFEMRDFLVAAPNGNRALFHAQIFSQFFFIEKSFCHFPCPLHLLFTINPKKRVSKRYIVLAIGINADLVNVCVNDCGL
jgi:hypothetical protein